MKETNYSGKHYPVEYLIFKCRNESEAKIYIEKNSIWTDFLAQNKGFVSSSSWVNKMNPGEVHIIIIWKTLEDWLSISKEELMAVSKQFDEAFGFPYEAGRRLHNETNFGYHKVSHYEV